MPSIHLAGMHPADTRLDRRQLKVAMGKEPQSIGIADLHWDIGVPLRSWLPERAYQYVTIVHDDFDDHWQTRVHARMMQWYCVYQPVEVGKNRPVDRQ